MHRGLTESTLIPRCALFCSAFFFFFAVATHNTARASIFTHLHRLLSHDPPGVHTHTSTPQPSHRRPQNARAHAFKGKSPQSEPVPACASPTPLGFIQRGKKRRRRRIRKPNRRQTNQRKLSVQPNGLHICPRLPSASRADVEGRSDWDALGVTRWDATSCERPRVSHSSAHVLMHGSTF